MTHEIMNGSKITPHFLNSCAKNIQYPLNFINHSNSSTLHRGAGSALATEVEREEGVGDGVGYSGAMIPTALPMALLPGLMIRPGEPPSVKVKTARKQLPGDYCFVTVIDMVAVLWPLS